MQERERKIRFHCKERVKAASEAIWSIVLENNGEGGTTTELLQLLLLASSKTTEDRVIGAHLRGRKPKAKLRANSSVSDLFFKPSTP